MRRRFAVAAAGALLLTGCGGSDGDKTEELQQFIRQAHEFDNGYDGLGDVEVAGDEVTVSTDAWADPGYGAYLYCSWVEQWVRGEAGDADSDIVVVMDGDEILRSRGESESCADAEPTTGP